MAPRNPVSKGSWSPSAEPPRRVGALRWDNGGPDKRTFGGLSSPRKENEEEITTFTKSPRMERKKEIIGQCALEDGGSSRTAPSLTVVPSLRSLA